MGLFTKSKPKEEEKINGMTQEECSIVGRSLGMKLGSRNLDAVLETFAPYLYQCIDGASEQVDLNLQLSIQIIERLKIIQEQQNELKEEIKRLKTENQQLRQANHEIDVERYMSSN